MAAIGSTGNLGGGTGRRPFPRLPLIGIAALVAFAISATVFGRVTEIGTLRNPTTAPESIRDIRYLRGDDETLTIVDARTGEAIRTLAPDEGGFLRGSLRGLDRDRKLRGIALDEPWRLILWDDGALTLSDTTTGQRYTLNGFGATNAAAFAALLDKRSIGQ